MSSTKEDGELIHKATLKVIEFAMTETDPAKLRDKACVLRRIGRAKPSIGDVLLPMASHLKRKAQQIERTINRGSFPDREAA